jgi:AcrR family transcriptional regulator
LANRMTRAESRVATRDRLLEAAAQVFAEKGFYGAAVEEIAERAGFTRGAFYSNFSGKDDLFLALFDDRMRRQVDQVRALLEASRSPEEFFAALRRRSRSQPNDPSWRLLRAEFWLYAMRNPEVRPKLAKRERALRRAYAGAIRVQFDALGLSPPGRPEDLALIVQILDRGTDTMRDIDPSGVRSGFLMDALAMLLEASVALAATRSARPEPIGRRGRVDGQ